MTQDHLANKLEEILQILVASNEATEKQNLFLERLAVALENNKQQDGFSNVSVDSVESKIAAN